MPPTESELRVSCPGCSTQVLWREDNPHRPFCSDRCRQSDFIAWANEEQRIPGNPDYEDLLSEDRPDQHSSPRWL